MNLIEDLIEKEKSVDSDFSIKLTEEEDFDRQRENAYVTDGEYMYYPVSKFSKSWIEKQPFDYIVRSD